MNSKIACILRLCLAVIIILLTGCAWSLSVYAGSPIPGGGGYNWYFEDDYGVRLIDRDRFRPVAEQCGLPYETQSIPLFTGEDNRYLDVWQNAYEQGAVPFPLAPLSDIAHGVHVSNQNKEIIAKKLSDCMDKWSSPEYAYGSAYDKSASAVARACLKMLIAGCATRSVGDQAAVNETCPVNRGRP